MDASAFEQAKQCFLDGLSALERDELALAEAAFRRSLQWMPGRLSTLLNLTAVLTRQARFADARAICLEIVALGDGAEEAWLNMGITYAAESDLVQALASFDKALLCKPEYAEASLHRGNVLRDLGQFDNAVQSYELAIRLAPQQVQAHVGRGDALAALERWAEAETSYTEAIALLPDDAGLHYCRGLVLRRLGRLTDALASLERAAALASELAAAHGERAQVLQALGRLPDALAAHRRVTELNPDNAEAYYNLGLVEQTMGHLAEAIASYDRAIALAPELVEALSNRGLAQVGMKQFGAAIASCEAAIRIKPGYALAHNNLGLALAELRRWPEAIAAYERAIALMPDLAEAHHNRGIALAAQGLFAEAVASHDQAIALKPSFAEAHIDRGHALKGLNRLDETAASYARALALKPDHDFLLGDVLHTRSLLCDWTAYTEQAALLEAGVREGRRVSLPFAVLPIVDLPAVQMRAAQIWCEARYPVSGASVALPRRQDSKRLRIGYFSPDFREHPVSYLTAQFFEAHDRQAFETIAFAFEPSHDVMRGRLERAFDRFIDVSTMSDADIVQQARALGLDIAVDLAGHTQDARTGVFALRVAPVQAAWLGYPGTMGADFIDYLIADKTVIPDDGLSGYSEKIVRLPYSYLVSDTARPISGKVFTRQEMGLPEEGFVFCCFNNAYKLNPRCFESWMRILRAVEGSVLWLSGGNPVMIGHLRIAAERQGVKAERLVFAMRVPSNADHLARQRLAGLFLDTLPYNAHTTALDALWVGLPVLTLMGQSFAGRVAASALSALDMGELITRTEDDYVAMAVELAAHPTKLAAIKARLAQNMRSAPLFDTKRFVRHMESAYRALNDRCLAGLPPDHIDVERLP